MYQYIALRNTQGMCNRIKVFFSSLRFDADEKEVVHLYWPIEGMLHKPFFDLFSFDLFMIDEHNEAFQSKDATNEISIGKKRMWRLDVENGEVPAGFTKAYPKTNTDKEECIDLEYNRIPDNVKRAYAKYFDALKPSKIVQARIDQLVLSQKTVGVHVRLNGEWTAWNRARGSGTKQFIKAMRKYSKDTMFFLASCNEAVAEEIRAAFPNRILELPQKDYLGDVDAAADLFLLSMTDELIVTFGSSFSEVAWWLGGAKAKVKVVGSFLQWRIQNKLTSVKAKIKHI